jgi:hypothetical protein
MESIARVRAGAVAIVLGVVVLAVQLSSTGAGGWRTTGTPGLGWPTIAGTVFLVLGVVVLVLGLRGRRREQREMEWIAQSSCAASDGRPED